MNLQHDGHDLQSRVQGYYEKQTLRPAKLAEIQQDINQTAPPSRHGRGRFTASRGPRIWAAAVLIALILGGVWAWPSGDRGSGLSRVVAQEIALNHIKALKADHPAAVFPQLASMSDKLGFLPVEPARLAERGLRLEGARYCSVQGCMAAQLRVVDADGGAYTLYQVRPDERLAALDAATTTVNGVDVELWNEAGLVMGLARTR